MTVKTPTNTVPGSPTVPPKYIYKGWPKVMYRDKEDLTDCITCEGPDDVPEGYVTYYELMGVPDPQAATAQADILAPPEPPAEPVTPPPADTAANSKQAEEDYRSEIMAFLDEYEVEYDKTLETTALEELKTALEAHLGGKGGDNS